MRPPFALFSSLVLLVAAGCVADEPQVRGEAFERVGTPWAFVGSGGCGLCSGAGGDGPHSEHTAFFVLADGRLVLVEFNERPDTDGFHAHPDVAVSGDDLERLLDSVPRAQAGETWVVRVATARAPEGTVGRLGALWTAPGPTQSAADYGVHYGRQVGDEETHHDLTGPLHEGDPFAAFLQELARLEDGTRSRGVWSGAAQP